MFYFHPAADVNVADIANIKRAMPFLHWGHALTSAFSALAFLVFAVVSRGSRPMMRLASGIAAVLLALMLWSGFRLTSLHSAGDGLRSYLVHTVGLPLVLSLGLMALAIFRLIGWLKTLRAGLGEGSV